MPHTPTRERPTRERPSRRAPARRAGLLAAGVAATLAGCDGATPIEATTGPGGATVLVGTAGSALAAGIGASDLLGRWTRVGAAAGGGVVTEVTWSFVGGGTGARTTATRTLLGVALAVDQAPFTWTAGGGVLLLRFPQSTGLDVVLRATYRVEAGLTGTALRLDGETYARASG